ncbi:MAG: bifunctional 4-hydroxy-2-oxoglutarate aldolase/2-dehydro-3-deoxy-phosphogluconate aldolase [Firmicutes bacterium]|nr:bifunctional 4-hydroxy-2-oxoglutarate aldolase/2-dehydro-3-deoxy-phosphogluconate aldolase [Bacillota bacterium]
MSSKIVAVLRKIDVTKAVPLAEALVAGGVTAMEVTMDTVGGLDAIRDIRAALGDKVVVGAGTVLDPETGRAALMAGAQFLVAPNLNVDLIKLGNRYGRMVIPGVMTPTEIQTAYEAGADIIKVFPASAVGLSFIKGVLGPLDHITVMATGGVSVETARDFLDAGVSILGVGGNLVNNKLIAEGKFDEITAYAKQLVEVANSK